MEIVNSLEGVEFDMTTSGKHSSGFIAQDVQQVMKELVTENNDPLKTLTLNYNGIIPVLVKAIQEQQKLIDNLKQENELLKAKVDQIEALKAEFEKFKSESK